MNNISSFSVALTRRRPLHAPRRQIQPSNNNEGQKQSQRRGRPRRQRSLRSSSSSSSKKGESFELEEVSNSDDENGGRLKRTLNLVDLIFYGVGCSVGAGIYSLVGIGASLAGPSIALSFLLCGTACIFTSLAYAEFASRVPLAGSAYTFTYVTFGELCGWLVGWNLTLGYAVSAAAVARSWSDYVGGVLESFVPNGSKALLVLDWLTHAPLNLPKFITGEQHQEETTTLTCSPLSMVIIAFCTAVLVTGAKESTRFNNAMTTLNLSVLGFVVLSGLFSGSVELDNLTPFLPHGLVGMARGAGLVFFSYLGFDMVSCLSEEVKDPQKTMPVGIIGSLVASMSIYVAVSLVVVGMAPVYLLGEDVPIVNALLSNGCCTHQEQLAAAALSAGLTSTTTSAVATTAAAAAKQCLSYSCTPLHHRLLYTGSRLVSVGAVFGLTTATFACLMGQPRIFYSMAQDGLMFQLYAKVNRRTGVPTLGTVFTGVLTALVACLIELESLANVISLGTLQVFTFVNAGVMILRMRPSSGGSASSSSSSSSSSSLAQEKRLEENGTKPPMYTLCFTLSVLLASFGYSREWHFFFILLFLSMAVWMAMRLSQLPQSIIDGSSNGGATTTTTTPFYCPMVPLVPLLGISCNCYMMGSMPTSSWYAISCWLGFGLVFYFCYGIHHSELRFTTTTTTTTTTVGGVGGGGSYKMVVKEDGEDDARLGKGGGGGGSDSEETTPTVQVSTPLLSEGTLEEGYDSIYDE